jgi:hypothetical protein
MRCSPHAVMLSVQASIGGVTSNSMCGKVSDSGAPHAVDLHHMLLA